MNIKTQVLFGREGRDKVFAGIEMIYRVVSPTLGASGRNFAYKKWGRAKISNDGVLGARLIDPVDAFEEMGVSFAQEVAEKTNMEVGDATSTTVVLHRNIIKEGLDAINLNANPMQLRREMQAALPIILEKLKEKSVPIETHEDLIKVATSSVESRELGELIAEAVEDAGENGIVSVNESDGLVTSLEKVESMQLEGGYTQDWMVTDPYKMEVVLRECPVLITDRSFNLEKELLPLIESLKKNGINRLLIIAEDISGQLLQFIGRNRMEGAFFATVVKKPNDNKILDDIAILTGGTSLTKDKGVLSISMGILGRVDKVIVKKNSTTLIGGAGDKEKFNERINELKVQIKDGEHAHEKENLQERLAKLVGKINVIHVGAPTESDMRYIKLKVDDAVNAAQAAKEEGIVAGGGSVLYHIANDLQDVITTKGGKILLEAMKKPMLKIMDNAGFSEVQIPEGYGFNALTFQMESDMFKAGIINAHKAERCALTNATSGASTFITTDSFIVEVPQEIKE